MVEYKVAILAVQETHLQGEGVINLTSETGNTFNLYYSGCDSTKTGDGGGRNNHGVGIITSNELNAKFTSISQRICMIKYKQENTDYIVLSVYAPTLPQSEKTPEKRDQFYEELDKVINSISNRAIIIIGGDLNAKTGSGMTYTLKPLEILENAY
jgi:exonuclease III